jgi:hypothetical protein
MNFLRRLQNPSIDIPPEQSFSRMTLKFMSSASSVIAEKEFNTEDAEKKSRKRTLT